MYAVFQVLKYENGDLDIEFMDYPVDIDDMYRLDFITAYIRSAQWNLDNIARQKQIEEKECQHYLRLKEKYEKLNVK